MPNKHDCTQFCTGLVEQFDSLWRLSGHNFSRWCIENQRMFLAGGRRAGLKRLLYPPQRIMNTNHITQDHYEGHSTESYESAYFYSRGEYTQHLSELVVGRLELESTTKRRILDIGGGTGNFTKSIVERSPGVEAVVIDPFLEMEQDTAQVKFVKASAEEFSKISSASQWWRHDYEQVLMKEVVHHLQQRAAIFKGILEGLDPEAPPSSYPNLLIITRPQLEIDYPLWDEARAVWAKNQPSHDEIKSELEEAGFSRIKCTIEPYPCKIAMDRWLGMVKDRFWSTFSNFTDEELAEACGRMRDSEKERIDDDGVIHFEDRLVFIAAYYK